MKLGKMQRGVFSVLVVLCMILVMTVTYVAACSCDAGGSGATACSIQSGGSSCSATCGSGYYACCTYGGFFSLASCKCASSGEDVPECHDE